jgi:hypothetical protein
LINRLAGDDGVTADDLSPTTSLAEPSVETVELPPRYRRARSIFLRALGLIYVAAFASLGVQVDGLVGSQGILPIAQTLERIRPILGSEWFRQAPTILWWNASDATLHALCWGGVALGVLLTTGVLPKLCLVFLWFGYLSLTVAGQVFLSFQWDSLLLETGLLAIFFAPWGVWLDGAKRDPSPIVLYLLRWLLFRLNFLSGLVKLASEDPAWTTWQALRYHYETQPLPTWTSWYIHQAPARFQSFSVGFMFWCELVAPLLIFGPRLARRVAFASTVTLQVLIMATGNYGFFNLLTIALALLLVEDRDWGVRGDRLVIPTRTGGPLHRIQTAGGTLVGLTCAVVVVALTTLEGVERIVRAQIPNVPEQLYQLRAYVRPFHSFNAYGLFAVMTTERPEIIVEGSSDGETWRPYTFRWKPGDPAERPRFTTPHMPRLDWQMWFAALARDCRAVPWFREFENRLLEGSPAVLGLLRDNPFPDHPPRYIRARLYDYRFTTWGSPDWWSREEIGFFCRPISRE